MYILLDLDIFSEFINIVYSVQVGREVRFAHRRNLPLSTSTAEKCVTPCISNRLTKKKRGTNKATGRSASGLDLKIPE